MNWQVLRQNSVDSHDSRDDLLATGGTIEATIKLVEELGGIVAGIAFLIELTDLDGKDKLEGYDVLTLMNF